MGIKEKAVISIDKLEKTTKMVLDLPDDVKLPNGWGKRELAIHLFSWDNEMAEYADHLREGNLFVWTEFHPEHLDLNAINKGFLDENEDLSFEEAIETFTNIRMELLETYNDILNNHFINEKSFADYFTMWMHDTGHLKQAGINTKKLEEN